jgi:hypothetical protein
MNKFLNGLRYSALACIISVIITLLIGAIIDPSLVSYTPEDPNAFQNQKNFAMIVAIFGIISGILFYKKS